MNETLEILKKGSLLAEGIEASDIADTDEIVTKVIDQKYKDSLSYQVCDVQPIHGPTGAVFAVSWDGTKVEVNRNNVSVSDDPLVNTGFTVEAIQDMQNQFGKDAVGFISKVFAGISASVENTNLITKMDAVALDKGTLTLTDATNAETNFFQVAQKVSESILEINSKHYRSFDAFVILPPKGAAALMGLGVYFNDEVANEAGLFLGKIRRTKYYINPDPLSTTCYVGINGSTPGSSSLVYSPYQHTLMTAVNPDSGEKNVFLVNRHAITENALSVVGDEMLHKFEIA